MVHAIVLRFSALLALLLVVETAGAADPPFQFKPQGQNYAYSQISISPDGSKILARGPSRTDLWDVASRTAIDLEVVGGNCDHVAFCHGGKIAALGHDSRKTIYVIEIPSGKVLAELKGNAVKAEAKDGDVVISSIYEKSKYIYAVWQASTGKEIVRILPNGALKGYWQLTPDGKVLAFFDDKDLRLFDLATGKERLGLPGAVTDASPVLSPDGKHLALFADTTVTVYDIADAGKRPKLVWRTEGIAHGNAGPRVSVCGFSPDGRSLMVCSPNASVMVDVATQKRGEKIVALYRLPLFTADGRTLVGWGKRSGSLVVANADGSPRTVIDVPDEFNALYLAERGNKAAALDKRGQLYIVPFDVPAASAVSAKAGASLPLPDDMKFNKQDIDYESLEFSPDGNFLVAAPSRNRGKSSLGRTGWLAVWDVASRKLIASPRLNNAGGWTFLPDGLFAWGPILVDTKTGDSPRPAYTFVNFKTGKTNTAHYTPGNAKEMLAVAAKLQGLFYTQTMRATPDGKLIFAQLSRPLDVSATLPSGIRDVEPKQGECTFALIDGKTFKITTEWQANSYTTGPRICFSPDGKLVARSDMGSGCKFWDLTTRKEVLTDAKRSDMGMDFADGGKLFCVYGGPNGLFIHVLDVDSGVKIKQINPSDGHSADVTAITVSPVSKLFVTCSSVGEVQIRDLESGAARHRFNGHKGPIIAATISLDGKTLATLGGEDRLVKLWPLGEK